MFKSQRRFIKKHVISVSIILVGFIAAGTGIYLYYDHTMTAIDSSRASTEAFIVSNYKKIADVNHAKAAAAAALKAQQEAAAAQAVADQSKNATSQTASILDSSACNNSTTHNNPSNIDVLVNKKHCLQPLAFAPSDLVYIAGTSFKLSAKAAPSFNAMSAAAAAAGVGFSVTSSYRSYSTQISTYNSWVATSGQAAADTYSARPGYSEHQTGLAVDLEANGQALSDFHTTSAYTWLQAHAVEYGFIQRYPAGYQNITGYETEEWHYRYVGVEVAQDMKLQNKPTLEQYWNMSGGDY